MPVGWSDEDYEHEGKNEDKLVDAIHCYKGKSDRDDVSTWRDLHLAIQRAAAVAARDLDDGEEAWFEVSRLQVKVGNPNIKTYSATLTKTSGGGH
jgi:hypothetical protein